MSFIADRLESATDGLRRLAVDIRNRLVVGTPGSYRVSPTRRNLPPTGLSLVILLLCASCARDRSVTVPFAPVVSPSAGEFNRRVLGEAAANPVDILIVSPGAGSGALGHAAIRLGMNAYAFDFDHGLFLYKELFPGFLYRYTVLQERDVRAVAIQMTPEATMRLTRRFEDEMTFVQETDYRRPARFFSNNCSTALFDELLVASGTRSWGWPWACVPATLPLALRRAFPVVSETVYPSRRHAHMMALRRSGHSVLPEYFCPASSAPGKRHSPRWRLVYTEDLTGPLALARPLAGIGNMSVSALQTVLGVLQAPADHGKQLGHGLSGFALAAPELLLFPIRHAGETRGE